MFSPDLNIRICKKILHQLLALFIQLFISEIILRITSCLFFKSKYNITHIFYNHYLYRTLNKYSHVKYSYCFVPVIHAELNLLESFPCGYFYFINCFNWYNSVVTVSFVKFWGSLALHIQVLFFWILMSLLVLKTESPFSSEMFVSTYITARYLKPELLLFMETHAPVSGFLQRAHIYFYRFASKNKSRCWPERSVSCYRYLVVSAGKN